jgi:hypothetical protein
MREGLAFGGCPGQVQGLHAGWPVRVHLIRFNGDGTVDVPGGRTSVNGAIFPTISTGTYTTPTPVDTGCESILTFDSPGNPTLYIFIARDAKTLQMTLTNPNTLFQGNATKVSH